MKRAMIAGSFDPITFGHINIIERASKLFDEVFVVVASNIDKKRTFPCSERIEMVENAIESSNLSNVYVKLLDGGLLAEFAYEHGVNCIVRGIRSTPDFQSEIVLANVNNKIKNIETIFIPATPDFLNISSSLCKAIVTEYGDVSNYTTLMAKYYLEKVISKNVYIGILKSEDSNAIASKLMQSAYLPRVEYISDYSLLNELFTSSDPYAWRLREELNKLGIKSNDAGHIDIEKFMNSAFYIDLDSRLKFNRMTNESIKHVLYSNISRISATESYRNNGNLKRIFLIEIDDWNKDRLNLVNNHLIISKNKESLLEILNHTIEKTGFGHAFTYDSVEKNDLTNLAESIHNYINN